MKRNFSKNIAHPVLICIFIVLGIAMIFFRSMSLYPHQTVSITSAFDYKIQYTPSGFVPDYIEVPIGSRVIFTNSVTGTPLWVASDPYPTSTDYPGFNAGKNYNNEVYGFTFNQAGTFGYHNQNVPIDRAIIVVKDPTHPTPDISKTKTRQEAIQAKLVAMLVPSDRNSIFKVVDAIQADSNLALDCHEIAHDIGHKAYELYGFSGAMTYDNPTSANHTSVIDVCAGGYVHGILEEASLHDQDFNSHPGVLCTKVPAKNTDSCYHGVGHALMFFNARDIKKSLEGCRSLSNTNDTSRCFEGVWMETFWGNTEHSGPDTLGWDLNAPLATCVNTEKDAKPACFMYATFGYLRTHVKDYTGAINLCTESGLDDFDASYCLRGVGILMVTHFKASHLEQAEFFTKDLSDSDKLGFYDGMMGYARLSGFTEKQLSESCESMKNDALICTKAIEETLD